MENKELIQIAEQTLEAYRDAGWEEADERELVQELASFLEGTDTTVLGPLNIKRKVQNLLDDLWRQVRDQLPDDPKSIDTAEKALIGYIVQQLPALANTFAAFFRGRQPQPQELAPIIALVTLSLIQRWKKYLDEQTPHPEIALE